MPPRHLLKMVTILAADLANRSTFALRTACSSEMLIRNYPRVTCGVNIDADAPTGIEHLIESRSLAAHYRMWGELPQYPLPVDVPRCIRQCTDCLLASQLQVSSAQFAIILDGNLQFCRGMMVGICTIQWNMREEQQTSGGRR